MADSGVEWALSAVISATEKSIHDLIPQHLFGWPCFPPWADSANYHTGRVLHNGVLFMVKLKTPHAFGYAKALACRIKYRKNKARAVHRWVEAVKRAIERSV